MIRKLADELLDNIDPQVFVGVALVTFGVRMLHQLAIERGELLASLDEAISDRRLTLAAVEDRLARAREKEALVDYPSQVDVDPLHRGQAITAEPEPAPAS